MITELQQGITRTNNPLHPAVITIGQISGGHAPNVIADSVCLTGIAQLLHTDTYDKLPDWIANIATDICTTTIWKTLEVELRLKIRLIR